MDAFCRRVARGKGVKGLVVAKEEGHRCNGDTRSDSRKEAAEECERSEEVVFRVCGETVGKAAGVCREGREGERGKRRERG